MEQINQRSFSQKFKDYRRHPLSLAILIFVVLSVVITVGVLLVLVVYVMIRGIPNLNLDLFAWEYNSENVSRITSYNVCYTKLLRKQVCY